MKRKVLLGVLSLACLGTLLCWPTVKRTWTLHEHRTLRLAYDPSMYAGGWFARVAQLRSPEWGPVLLRDPEVIRHRLAELSRGDSDSLVQYRGEWALMFAALRLQGQSRAEILASSQGLELGAATLAAEADPPAWWAEQTWLLPHLQLHPDAAFRLGLLGREDADRLAAAAPGMHLKQVQAMVHCCLRLEGGLSREQSTQVLRAWLGQQHQYFAQNNLPCVERVLALRDRLIEVTDPVASPQRLLGVRIVTPDGLKPEERECWTMVARDFLRSCGYRVTEGDALRLELSLQEVDFDNVAADFFVPYQTSERVKVGTVRVGKYATSDVFEQRPVTRNERKSQVGKHSVLSLTMTARVGKTVLPMAAPPYGQLSQSDIDDSHRRFTAETLSDEDRRQLGYTIMGQVLLPWRYGLSRTTLTWEPLKN